MRTVRLGRTNLELTKWGLGGASLSTLFAGTTEEEIDRVIRAALDRGINIIDTARSYMDAEENIGRAMQQRRTECVLASKSLGRSRDEMLADIETSLQSLQTDMIDIYQIHELRPEEAAQVMGKAGALQGLREAQDQGMIGYTGLTSHFTGLLLELARTGEFDTLMFAFNIVEREPEKELLALARSLDIGTFAARPLLNGAIADRRSAFRFVNMHPVDVILNGVATVAELEENLALFEDTAPLTPQEIKNLEQALGPLTTEFCRRCKDCLPCPNDILVPLFSVVYQAMAGKKFDELAPEQKVIGSSMLPWIMACQECGQCEQKCPQHLPIIERKRALYELFAPSLAEG